MPIPFLFCSKNGAAAYDDVTVVEDYCLAGGDGPLGFVKNHPGKAVFHGIDGGVLLRHPGTSLGFDLQGLC